MDYFREHPQRRAGKAAIDLIGAATLTNQGLIAGYFGVILGAGSTVTNKGSIYGAFASAEISGGTLLNTGTMDGDVRLTGGSMTNKGSLLTGAALSAGSLTNDGNISANFWGLDLNGGTVTNHGSVYGLQQGALLYDGGMLDNTGSIGSGDEGVYLRAGTVINAGVVTGSFIAVSMEHAYKSGKAGATFINSGTIAGAQTGIDQNGGYFRNTGTIAATIGIALDGGLSVNKKFITASSWGAQIDNGTFTNSGTIIGDSLGVDVNSFGSFLNSGTVAGGNSPLGSGAVGVLADEVTVTNDGIILGGGGESSGASGGDGVSLGYVALLTNHGVIEGGYGGAGGSGGAGVSLTSGASFINDGLVLGGSDPGLSSSTGIGAVIYSGFALNNSSISGSVGIALTQGTIVNAGVITGTGGIAVEFNDGLAGVVVDDPGSVFNGKIEAAGSIGGELKLASGSKTGTLAGLDPQFSGVSSIAVDPGAEWNIAGQTTIYAGMNFTNNGTIIATRADELTVNANMSGSGLTILDSTTLVLDGNVAAGQNISFEGKADTLALGHQNEFKGTITSFALGDTIDLTNVARDKITGEYFAGGVLTLTEANGSIALSFANLSSLASGFSLSASGSGTDIRLVAATPAVLQEMFSAPADPKFLFGGFTTPVSYMPLLATDGKAGNSGWQTQVANLAKEVFSLTPTLTTTI